MSTTMATVGEYPQLKWSTLGEAGGVTLRATGEGESVFVFPGMEGSGESCLHLAAPVLEEASARGMPHRLVLVDYGGEAHDSLEDLFATMADLVAAAAGGEPCTFWAQSFGNILAARVSRDPRLQVRRFVLVSPFTRLSPVRAHLGALAMGATPGFAYRATIKPIGRLLFGPPGDRPEHPFFDALQAAPGPVFGNRTGWLRSRDFASDFEAITAPAKVWLGERDRLVELERQKEFFAGLARTRPNYHFETLSGPGHVVLDSAHARRARESLLRWITEGV